MIRDEISALTTAAAKLPDELKSILDDTGSVYESFVRDASDNDKHMIIEDTDIGPEEGMEDMHENAEFIQGSMKLVRLRYQMSRLTAFREKAEKLAGKMERALSQSPGGSAASESLRLSIDMVMQTILIADKESEKVKSLASLLKQTDAAAKQNKTIKQDALNDKLKAALNKDKGAIKR